MTDALPRTRSHVDIVALVRADHSAIGDLFDRFAEAEPGDRLARWRDLARALVAHDLAEEEVVYAAIRRCIDGLEREIKARLSEKAEAEELVTRLGRLDPSAPQFAAAVARLGRAVMEHAEAEEHGILSAISRFGAELDRPTLGERYEQSKVAAPASRRSVRLVGHGPPCAAPRRHRVPDRDVASSGHQPGG